MTDKLQAIYDQVKTLEYSRDNIVELISLYNEAHKIAVEANNKLLAKNLAQTQWKEIGHLSKIDESQRKNRFIDAQKSFLTDLRHFGRCS